MGRVTICPATVEDVDALTEAWVALAAEQRRHGSRLHAEANRPAVREDLSRRAVLGEALLARIVDGGDATEDSGEGDESSPSGRVVGLDLSLTPGAVADGTDLPPRFVGFVSFGVEADGFERSVTRGAVHNLYVRPGARSRGVGRALLSAAEDELREAGAERVALEALADNERARAFYRRAGYGEHRVELEKRLE